MTWVIYVNLFFVVVNGAFAISCFIDGNKKLGWFNLFASAFNASFVADWIL